MDFPLSGRRVGRRKLFCFAANRIRYCPCWQIVLMFFHAVCRVRAMLG
ncbi:hypothetical protein ACM67C_06800 [Bergeriella denitrificans]